jgi:hypothetical protein
VQAQSPLSAQSAVLPSPHAPLPHDNKQPQTQQNLPSSAVKSFIVVLEQIRRNKRRAQTQLKDFVVKSEKLE